MNKEATYKSIAELLTNEGFLGWCLVKNDRNIGFWSAWIAENQEHAELAEQAKQVVTVLLTMKKERLSDYQINNSFERLFKKMSVRMRKLQGPG